MKICAYTYEADIHCIDCAVSRFGVNHLEDIKRNTGYGYVHRLTDGTTEELDENLIPLESKDNEGNLVQPVFGFDSILNDHKHCGTCHNELQY